MILKSRVLALLILLCGMVLTAVGCASSKSNDQPMLGQRMGTYMDDSYLTSAVKTKLVDNIALKSFDIHVVTKNGVVTLNGTLPNTDLSDEAVRTAKSVSGVRNVIDNIEIKPNA